MRKEKIKEVQVNFVQKVVVIPDKRQSEMTVIADQMFTKNAKKIVLYLVYRMWPVVLPFRHVLV